MTRETSEKETKRRKIDISEAPDSEWPEAWVMSDDVEDQKAENRLEPNVPATVTDLRKLGIRCVIVQFVEKERKIPSIVKIDLLSRLLLLGLK